MKLNRKKLNLLNIFVVISWVIITSLYFRIGIFNDFGIFLQNVINNLSNIFSIPILLYSVQYLLLTAIFMVVFYQNTMSSRSIFFFMYGMSLSIFFIFLYIILAFNLESFFHYYTVLLPRGADKTYIFNYTNTFIISLNNSSIVWSYQTKIDELNIFFCLLTALLIPLCIFFTYNQSLIYYNHVIIALLSIELFLLNVFLAVDLLWFYIFFESVLIPMFFLIGIWGSRKRKLHAMYMLVFYTLIGSVFMLLGILYLLVNYGTTNFELLSLLKLENEVNLLIWFFFFLGFATKIPMFPLHIWLPEAHVEAPTIGSVLLAGVLLKLGSFGMLKILIGLFIFETLYFLPLIHVLALLAIIYCSFTTLRQIDFKKIIAYSSVAHMNFALLGLFSNVIEGLHGSVFIMLSHGLVSSALFFSIGIIYDRYHTRNLKYYGGLVFFMPFFSIFLLIFSLANLGFPGTSNFIGEFLTLVGISSQNFSVAFLSGVSLIIGAIYSIWLYNRLVFGILQNKHLLKFMDLYDYEFFILFVLAFLILFFGIYPNSYFFVTTVYLLKLLI